MVAREVRRHETRVARYMRNALREAQQIDEDRLAAAISQGPIFVEAELADVGIRVPEFAVFLLDIMETSGNAALS